MYSIVPNYNDRYVIVKISGTFSLQETIAYEQNFIDFAVRIGFKRFALVTDMRENLPVIVNVTKEFPNWIGDIMRRIGLTCLVRVFDPNNSNNVDLVRQSIIKTGYMANYFTDMDNAVNYVIKILSGFPVEPVISLEEARKMLNEQYGSLGFKI